MESDFEDVQRITQFINVQKKANYQNNFHLEFQDFITVKQDFDDDFSLEEEENIENENDVETSSTTDGSIELSTTTLTEDERSVIESCTDPDLKKLLILNRTKNMQLIKLHKKIKDLNHECEEVMLEKNLIMKNLETRQLHRQQPLLWKLAAPYFKDKKYYQCPLNEDSRKKRSNNELIIYELSPSPKWTTIEINRLINAVKCSYNVNRQNNIVQKINVLKAETYDVETRDETKVVEIKRLEEELQKVREDDEIPPLNSNEFINWKKVSETFLKDRHTPYECQSVWHLLVHPDINKTEWTEEENKSLEVIAKRYSYQNWEAVAVELNTKRTGFTTCLHYFSKLCDKFKKTKFTPEEDKLLLEVVDSYKIGNHIPWHKVVYHFNNRSRHQLFHRYSYFLSQDHVKKGKFSEAEDILLIILVNKFGRNFKKCAEYMPRRSQVQLKSRYISNLQRDIKKGTFTVEDDQMILDYVKKHGEKNWSGLTEKLNRCNAQIRQRYKLIKSFLQANPEAQLKDVPKRKHNFDKANEDQYSFLNYMAEQYKDSDCIPTLKMIEESLQVELEHPSPSNILSSKNKSVSGQNKQNTSLKNIDLMLVDYFANSLKGKQNNVADMNITEACNNVEEIMSLLGVKLNIPKVFEYNIHLDNIDVEILKRLSKLNYEHNKPEVDTLLTPNINTLVGLRSLIIKHKDYKIQQKNENLPSTSKGDKVIWSMEQNLSKLNESTKKEVLRHRDLFSKRFDALFNWSAVLSLEKSNHITYSENANLEKSKASLRTYLRRSVDSSNDKPVTKKRKIDNSTLIDLGKQSNINNCQLQIVDKSVVEKLKKSNNNINIIQITTFTDSPGVIKPILQQNTLTINTPQQMNITSVAEKNKDNEDIRDVQKLDVRLKSKALNDPQLYSSEEYRAIEGDVQLLKEILQYEKIKVEPNTND